MKTCEYCSNKIILGKHDNCERYYSLLCKIQELDYCKKQCDPKINPFNSNEFQLRKALLEQSIFLHKSNLVLRYSTVCRINHYYISKNDQSQKTRNELQPFMEKLGKISNRCTNLNNENELDLASDIKTILKEKTNV